MNDEVKSAEEQVQEEEENWTIHTTNRNFIRVFLLSEETIILLSRTPMLYYVYSILWYLENNRHFLMGWKQQEVADYLRITPKSLRLYLQELEKMGLISFEQNKFGINRKNIIFNNVRSLSNEQIERLSKVSGVKGQQKVLEELRQQITTTKLIEDKQIKDSEQAALFIEQSIKQGVEKEVKKVLAKKNGSDQKFPIGDYTSVLDGYRKYKGIFIKSHSPDEARYRKAAKNMFLSGWKVLDILECMKFFNKYCKLEGYEWMTAWTLETIGKKMGDFKAGNLKRPELGDDLQEYTG